MAKQEKSIEAFALERVKANDRKSWPAIAAVQAGMFICVPSLLLGSLLAESMPLWQAITAGLIGYLITLVLTFVLGMQGADLGIPSCVITLSTFGRRGSRYIVSVLLAISMIGWFGIQINVCGEAFVNLLHDAIGVTIPVTVSSIIWGLVMLLTAVFGMNALKKLDAISIPLMLILMLVGTIMAFRNFGTDGLHTDVEQTMTIVQGIGLSFSFTAVSAVTCSDITRFQRNRHDTIKSTFWGIMPAAIFTLLLGILMTKIAGVYDITQVLAVVGIPIFGVIVLILATWTTNSLNAYSAGLDVVMAFKIPDNRRRETTLICGIIGIILAVFGILGRIELFLSLLSYVFSAMGGIMVADYWVVGKGKARNWHAVEGFNWTGIISLVIAIAAAALIGIEYTGILWGFIVYLILERFIPSKSRNENPDSEIEIETEKK